MSTMTTTKPISSSDDIIDSRDIIARIEELESRTQCDNCGEPAHEDDNGAGGTVVVHDHGSTVCSDEPAGSVEKGDTTTVAELADPLDEGERAELAALNSLADEASGYSGDWQYGSALIRDSYFEDYAQQTAEDIGAIDPNASWPLNRIDWAAAADDLKMDYTSVDFEGVTYWVR